MDPHAQGMADNAELNLTAIISFQMEPSGIDTRKSRVATDRSEQTHHDSAAAKLQQSSSACSWQQQQQQQCQQPPAVADSLQRDQLNQQQQKPAQQWWLQHHQSQTRQEHLGSNSPSKTQRLRLIAPSPTAEPLHLATNTPPPSAPPPTHVRPSHAHTSSEPQSAALQATPDFALAGSSPDILAQLQFASTVDSWHPMGVGTSTGISLSLSPPSTSTSQQHPLKPLPRPSMAALEHDHPLHKALNFIHQGGRANMLSRASNAPQPQAPALTPLPPPPTPPMPLAQTEQPPHMLPHPGRHAVSHEQFGNQPSLEPFPPHASPPVPSLPLAMSPKGSSSPTYTQAAGLQPSSAPWESHYPNQSGSSTSALISILKASPFQQPRPNFSTAAPYHKPHQPYPSTTIPAFHTNQPPVQQPMQPHGAFSSSSSHIHAYNRTKAPAINSTSYQQRSPHMPQGGFFSQHRPQSPSQFFPSQSDRDLPEGLHMAMLTGVTHTTALSSSITTIQDSSGRPTNRANRMLNVSSASSLDFQGSANKVLPDANQYSLADGLHNSSAFSVIPGMERMNLDHDLQISSSVGNNHSLVGGKYLGAGFSDALIATPLGTLHGLPGGSSGNAAGSPRPNPKGALQELYQKVMKTSTTVVLKYSIHRTGVGRFMARVDLPPLSAGALHFDGLKGTGFGRSKKEAEQHAASDALDKLKELGVRRGQGGGFVVFRDDGVYAL